MTYVIVVFFISTEEQNIASLHLSCNLATCDYSADSILLLYLMTTLTIDEPIKLKKNKFASIMEAMYYLALAGQKQAISATKKQYIKAKQDYEQ
jgi:hypothetical protein